MLELRQKNLQLVNSSNKKEREEIEFLKRELARLSEEAKAKEVKQKATIERMRKQGEELQRRNKELTDEVRLLEQERLSKMSNNGSGAAAAGHKE